MNATLVILAAGMGRRFGGLKQLTPLGPGGATLMDYTIHDALRAGISRVAWVTRPELEQELHAHIAPRWKPRVDTRLIFQRIDDLPAGFDPPPARTRPWGTGQAVLAAATTLDGPFVMANADDFYGQAALQQTAAFLRKSVPGAVPEAAVVGYALRDTLSPRGPVARAICEAASTGGLRRIVERTELRRLGDDAEYVDADGTHRAVTGDTPVSMNLWAVPRGVGPPLRDAFARFLERHGRELDAEFYWPAAVNELLTLKQLTARVLPGGCGWCGLTHPDDRELVATQLRQLTAAGVYPERLW